MIVVDAMTYQFCTLFDRNYLSRGLALYRSLEKFCLKDFRLTILAMDDLTRDILTVLRLPKAEIITINELNDPELSALHGIRPTREFCWTCAPALLWFMVRRADAGQIITYLDADLRFFSDVAPIFSELGQQDILIHEHRYSPRHAHHREPSGIFNVGLIAVRHATQGLQCLDRWRRQCLDCCELAPERGMCGDQKYLDEWPDLYDRLVILQHKGAGLAPWNIDQYKLVNTVNGLTIDDQPLIFFHYHALRIISASCFGFCLIMPSWGYEFTPLALKALFKPYAAELRRTEAMVRRLAPASAYASPTLPLRELWRMFRSRRSQQVLIG